MNTIDQHRTREARVITTAVAAVCALGCAAAVVPGAEQRITTALAIGAASSIQATLAIRAARTVGEVPAIACSRTTGGIARAAEVFAGPTRRCGGAAICRAVEALHRALAIGVEA